MAKTDWTYEDIVKPEDMNELGQEINDNKSAAQVARQKAEEAQSDLTSHENATLVHGATDDAMPNRIALRDASGQFMVGVPTDSNHVARKAEVDAIANNAAGWKVFNNITELGLTEGSETMEAICRAMPDKSELRFQKFTTNPSTAYPATAGMLFVRRYSTYRVALKFFNGNGRAAHEWIGYFDTNVNPNFSGWVKVESVDGAQAKANTAEQSTINWVKSFGLGTNALRTSTNLNDEKENGWVLINDTTVNRPSDVPWGICRIEARHPNQVYQTALRTDASTVRILTRKLNTTWTEWLEIWHSGNFDPSSKVSKAGDTMNGNLYVPALISSRSSSPTIAIRHAGEDVAVRATLNSSTFYIQRMDSSNPIGSWINDILRASMDGSQLYTGQGKTVFHTGNFDPNTKVSKAGAETITGEKTFAALQKFNSEVHCSGNFPLHFLGGANDTPNKRNYRWDVVEDMLRLQALNDSLAYTNGLIELKHDGSSFKFNGSEVWTNRNNSASLAQAGYQCLASGLIIQWGYGTPPTSGEYPVTFPIAFPNYARNITISPSIKYDNYAVDLSVWSSTRFGFTANFKYSGEQGGGRGFYWFAVGH
ncbi:MULTISPECIES: pyocin knob domain-containing protein [unclassified Paenibacillus]|uniref:pyocin knob domain-containing protein n=1 Tax=unclassified Paenibacillus TaxID=185978 RepID=UPI0011A21267|nr:pyocin knob domain-containing protein [Paenibacillus sp. 32O-W]